MARIAGQEALADAAVPYNAIEQVRINKKNNKKNNNQHDDDDAELT